MEKSQLLYDFLNIKPGFQVYNTSWWYFLTLKISKDVKKFVKVKYLSSSYHYIFYTTYMKNISLHCISSVEHLFVYIKSGENELKKVFRKIV